MFYKNEDAGLVIFCLVHLKKGQRLKSTYRLQLYACLSFFWGGRSPVNGVQLTSEQTHKGLQRHTRTKVVPNGQDGC